MDHKNGKNATNTVPLLIYTKYFAMVTNSCPLKYAKLLMYHASKLALG